MERFAALAVTLAALALGSPAAASNDVQGVGDVALRLGARDVMVVPNAEGGTVSVIDARTFELLREIDVLPDGRETTFDEDPAHAAFGQQMVEAAGGANFVQDVDISPDGRTLYVSRGHRGDVAAFDLARGALEWKVRIPGFRSDHMTLSGDGRRLYVSALTEDEVEVVDTETGTIVASIATGQWPHDNHIGDSGLRVGERLYNGSIGNILVPPASREASATPPYQLTVVDAETLEPLASHAFERGIRPFVLTQDEERLYAQLSEYHGVIEFGIAEGRILRTRDLPVDDGVTEDDYDFEAPHHGLALSHDERTLCAAGRASDYVALISTATFRPTAIIEVDDAPGWAAVSPDGRYCFVANTRADTVSVISFAERREVKRVKGGDGPKLIQAARLPADVVCPLADVRDCPRRLQPRPWVRLVGTCIRGAMWVKLRKADEVARRVTFRVGGRIVARDTRAPFRYRFSRRQLARLHGRRVTARARVTIGPTRFVKRSLRLRRCD